jgi:hypothetical protein
MRFGQDKAGKKAKCPKCGALNVIAAEVNGKETEPEPAPPPAKPGDDLGAYGVTDVISAEEQAARTEAAKAKRPDVKKTKKAPKIAKKIKSIPDADLWDKVRGGLLLMFIGACLWGAAHLLQGLYVALGTVDYTEYTRMLAEELNARRQPMPQPGEFWDVNPLNILLGMIAGSAFLGLAKMCLSLGVILRLCQPIVSSVGYILCLPVPARFGTKTQLTVLLALGGWNTLMVLALMTLPVLGIYQYILVPLLTPEVVLTEYNMERSIPINVLWMGSPFTEALLNLFVQFLYNLEPVIGCVFLWSIGLSIKEQRLQDQAQGLAQLGLGQFFILLSFHMISMAGTTPVLVTLLRVLYTLWWGFLLLFILSYAGLLLKTRELIYLKINPPNEQEEPSEDE